MAITKPLVRDFWADTAATPGDILDPGAAFEAAGWPLSTTPPSRQYFNWILSYCANAVRYFSRRGIADYDPLETYAPNDITRGPDNILYQSLVAANIANAPGSSPTFWAPLPYVTSATLAVELALYVTQTALTQDLLAYVTQTSLATQLALYESRAQLGIDLAPYATIAALIAGLALKAPLASPLLSGIPSAPTALSSDSSTQLATTQFAQNILAAAVALLAPKVSPAFSGIPSAPTPAAGDNSTRLATTQFVMGQSNLSPNGYAKLPNGLMFAWGLATVPASTAVTVNFAATCGAAFPHACFGVNATLNNSVEPMGAPFVYSVSAAGFTLDNTYALQFPTYWFAWGN